MWSHVISNSIKSDSRSGLNNSHFHLLSMWRWRKKWKTRSHRLNRLQKIPKTGQNRLINQNPFFQIPPPVSFHIRLSFLNSFSEEVDIPETLPSSTPVIPEDQIWLKEKFDAILSDLAAQKEELDTLKKNLDSKVTQATTNLSSFTSGLIKENVGEVSKVRNFLFNPFFQM